MDDDVELFFGGEFELLTEELGLARFVIRIVPGGAGVLTICAGIVTRIGAREAGVIEAAFADGHYFRMVGEGAKLVG